MHITISIFLFLLINNVTAMTSREESKIPIPEKNFQCDFSDVDNMETEGFNVTFNGKTFISGKRGATEIYIPFERIETIEVQRNNEVITREMPDITLQIILVDGTDLTLNVKSDSALTGEAPFGQFRIRIDHIKRIQFSHDE